MFDLIFWECKQYIIFELIIQILISNGKIIMSIKGLPKHMYFMIFGLD